MKTVPEIKTIILGLSGGPDSVYLLHKLKPLHDAGTIKLVAAHLNHEWRANAAADSDFCAQLCKTLNIPFVAGTASSLALNVKPNGSREEVGRKLRRFFLESTAKQYNASKIALAHHRDDQYETFFMRLARGASLTGLTCMHAVQGMYMRPLLDITKHDILAYLEANKITYLHDPSNSSDEFLRNRIRKYIMPALKQCDDRFDEKIATTIAHLQEDNEFLEELAQQAFEKVFKENLTGSLQAFRALHKQLKQRLIINWLVASRVPFKPSSAFMHEIITFLEHQNGGSHTIGVGITVHKKQQSFWLEYSAD